MDVIERFLNYVAINTQSKPNQECIPSTECQKDLARYLVQEMKGLGIVDAEMDEHGYVMGTVPATITDRELPVLGFIAHMDTAPDSSGKDVKPRIVKNYQGEDILLNKERDIVMRPTQFEGLRKLIGQDIIVTDGTTLLGADNKAGIAEIITMAEYLIQNPQIPHGKIRIGFTPDEEVGRGAERFDVKRFGAALAYTVDGGELGELEYENFNAASVTVTVHGAVTHTGSAKNKLVNSQILALELFQMLPAQQRPEHTEGREGFTHLASFVGNVDRSEMHFIIRDHDREKFEEKKARFEKIKTYLNEKYGRVVVEVSITDTYYNMKEKILPHMELIEVAKQAMEEAGIEPLIIPVRGGTDGAMLSYKGLPCPNICAGTENAHGVYEYVSVQSMHKIVSLLERIAILFAEQH